MRRRRFAMIFTVLLPLTFAAGPATGPATRAGVDWDHTFLLHLPGIAGARRLDREMVAGLKDGGWEGPNQTYDWTENDPGLDALRNRKRNEGEAEKVAKLIADRVHEDPACKVVVVSHSGGTGIAIWALEDLPDDVKVQTLILLASAVSPQYDLSRALSHVRGNAYVYYSAGDSVVLGTGTTLFGTIDGVRGVSGGLVGFKPPAGADREQYQKLIQKPYEKGWMALGHSGTHIGSLSRRFAERVLAPLMLDSLTSSGPTTRPAQTQPGQSSAGRSQTGQTPPPVK